MAKTSGTKYSTARSEALPPNHKHAQPGMTNMKAPGSDGMAHPPNGQHKATNPKGRSS